MHTSAAVSGLSVGRTARAVPLIIWVMSVSEQRLAGDRVFESQVSD
jgi:hypothetical protein